MQPVMICCTTPLAESHPCLPCRGLHHKTHQPWQQQYRGQGCHCTCRSFEGKLALLLLLLLLSTCACTSTRSRCFASVHHTPFFLDVLGLTSWASESINRQIVQSACLMKTRNDIPSTPVLGCKTAVRKCSCHGCLQVNTTLERLELNGNAIDESGVTALAESLVENKTLQALALR